MATTKTTKEKKPARNAFSIADAGGEVKPAKVEKKEVKEVDEMKAIRESSKEKDSKKTKTHPLIIGARITEKGALLADKGIYTFNVTNNANKNEIKKAIKMVYGITPVKVGITQITMKKVFIRGKKGVKQGGKKAVVHLKKGDKIEFI